MKNNKIIISFFLLFVYVFQITAQTSSDTSTTFNTESFPQWAKDMRRFDIIAFGSFPFSMFTATFFMDVYRWNTHNNDFAYAPWPLKSANAVEMNSDEFKKTILIAAGLSLAIALTDLIIVKIKRSKERRRIESMPSGSVTINNTPYGIQDEESENTAVIEDDSENIENSGEPDTE
jgi:hypothetical protein